MAQDNPNVIELVQTVREFIEEITAKLDGQDRYHALCAAFLLEIVQRELSSEWQPVETSDDKRLKTLLGDEVSKQEILSSLSQAIREGRFKDRESEMFDTLLQHVEAKIAVIKPSYIDQFK
mgnify:CR=1 FL=1